MANDRFDKEAASWDSNPVTVKSSKLAFGALLEHVPEVADENKAKGMRILLFARSSIPAFLSFENDWKCVAWCKHSGS